LKPNNGTAAWKLLTPGLSTYPAGHHTRKVRNPGTDVILGIVKPYKGGGHSFSRRRAYG
jgi:hypothetical protein